MEKVSTWTKIFLESLTVMGENIMAALPGIIMAILIIIIGWIVAKILRLAVSKGLRLIKFDKLFENINAAEFLDKANISISPSHFVGKFVYWIILLIFFVLASDTLGWIVVSESISDLIFYLPKLFSAIVVFVIGLYIANFIKKALLGIFDSLNVTTGKVISSIAFYIIIVIISITALNQAGVDTQIVTSNVNLIIGGVLLAFAVAFGFGAKDILGNILSAFYSRNTFKIGQKIEIGEIKGEIEKIESTSVTIKTDKGIVVIPSGKLVSEKVTILN